MTTTLPLCIYHARCNDGFAAAWAVRKALGADGAVFLARDYRDPPPDVRGRDVVIVDFSYPRQMLEVLAAQARSILILDHHKKAAEDLAGLAPATRPWPPAGAGPHGVTAIFDMQRSGAGLTWDFFHPFKPRPRMIHYIENYDLWQHKEHGTQELHATICSHPYDFATWDILMTSPIEDMVKEGVALMRKQARDLHELLARTRRRLRIAGFVVPAANMPATMRSEAGHVLAAGAPFAAIYWDEAGERVFSLRSAPDGADVDMIARQFGEGGGHRHAAGFSVPLAEAARFEIADVDASSI